MKFSNKNFSNKKGQAVLESVLLMAVVITTWIAAAKVLRDRNVFQEIFGDPWGRLASTIEEGIPISSGNSGLKALHPTGIDRHSTRLAKASPP